MNTFVTSRGWYDQNSQRPQTPRNLAISLADVALYLLQLASVSEIDLEKAILDKLEINKTREWDQK